jgi:hypothetical protein
MSSGYSYNGWPANSDPAAIGVVQSLWFPGGAKAGDVTTVMRYVAEQFNARVEPIVGGWCWGYTYKQNVNNPSSLSCHASGTALDINAPDHPNGSGGTFSDAQRGQIYAILDECQGAVSWLEGYDEMHFEIQVSAAELADVAASLPAGGGPPNTGDWFDMATEDDLYRVVNDVLDARLADIGVTVWTTGINEQGAANALLAQAASMAQSAADQCAVMPTAVWTKGITDETDAGKANALLAKAANG